MHDDDEVDAHSIDDVKETGVVNRPHAYDPEEENMNDAEFGLAGLSLTAAATAGKGLPEMRQIDEETGADDVTSWEANHSKDTWL